MRFWRRLRWLALISSKIVATLLFLGSLCASVADRSGWPGWTQSVAARMTHHLWLIVLVYGVVVAARYLIVWTAECRMRRLGGGNPPIKGILDALCEYAARDEEDAYRHRYRVTLFKNHGNKWLKIYARSGNITLGSRTRFRIDPNNEPGNEGVAGVCWFRDQVISVSELPDLTREPTEEEIQDYALRTFYDVKKIMARLHRERPIHTRSLLGA